jgi:isoleucyl-tRNA synthetase
MYDNVTSKVDFPGINQEILEKWSSEKTFEESLALHDREMVFYDGPPFPTGAPHHGTIFVSILKDSLARFFTMQGANVPRVWGWDCHGLPIENAVEKQMGIENKSDIETKYSVAKFNEECRSFVSDCNDSWEEYITRIGRWVDYHNAYRTLDPDFMESVLWVFKSCHDKKLIYKDYRVTPYCYHCETALSISDTRESDSTRERQDPEVIVRFRADEDIDGKPTWFMAWTTTPWTLISNLALAVGPEYDYVAVESGGEIYVLAEALLPSIGEPFTAEMPVVARFKGADLIGKSYQPMFPYFSDIKGQGYFRILDADFVTLEDGTGIVHIAPAFGEDDYWVCKRNGLGVRNPVDSKGCFSDEITLFAGRNVHECNKDVIRYLKDNGIVLRHKTLVHNYPHCWRCREPLIYRAMDAWYFAVEKIKDRMIELNEDINWVPEHVKHGRFGKWLAGARDWNISRNRYWGTPIPVWECSGDACEQVRVLGSFEEIESASGIKLTDLHKEFLDEITLSCDQCGSTMHRVPEVLDCWFESGSMPYGQCHYPFENKEWFNHHFPADFIVEYPGQIRGWFYYLHVLSTALMDRPSFKNCLVHGTLLAEDGNKISKSLKNYTDPMQLIERYGADAVRVYLLSSPAAAMQDLNFKDEGIEEQIRNVMLPLWNAYSFFVTYANIDGFRGNPDHVPDPANLLDRWILAMLYSTEKELAEAFSTYHLNKSLSPVLSFIEDLTNWYIRRSRERFYAKDMTEDKKDAYETLYYVLITMMKLLAPSAPFISEKIFCNLTDVKSVHLQPWPQVPDHFHDDRLISEIKIVRIITTLGLSLRQKLKLKVKQPLAAVHIALPRGIEASDLERQFDVIKDELRVKELEVIDDPSHLATLRGTPNARVLGPIYGKEVQHIIKAAREGHLREEGDKVIVFNADKEWTLDRDQVEIGYQGRDGLDVASESGILVALDAEVTDELREEGIARELNRLIQNMRKEAGYEVSDRITLSIDGPLESSWQEWLAEMTLATLSELSDSDADAMVSHEVDGRTFSLKVCKTD